MKLILLFAIIIALQLNCKAQTTFTHEFKEVEVSPVTVSDSVKFMLILKEIASTDTSKIAVTTEQLLLVYMHGYINGSMSFEDKGSFDFDRLDKDVRSNKFSIRRYIVYVRRLFTLKY